MSIDHVGHVQGLTIIGPPLHYWYLSLSKVQVAGLTGSFLLSAMKNVNISLLRE